jgi:hypothetical protein
MVSRPINMTFKSPKTALTETINTPERKAEYKMNMNSRSNVAIASAITAYARVELAKLMLDPRNPVFYHDTDSIIVQKPLNPEVVGEELGQMKLEYTIKEGIFAGPKLYAVIKGNNNVTIKAKGCGAEGLTYESYKALLRGERLSVSKEY